MRPDTAHPRRLAPPSGSTCGRTPSCPPAAPGIHGWATPDGPDLLGRTLKLEVERLRDVGLALHEPDRDVEVRPLLEDAAVELGREDRQDRVELRAHELLVVGLGGLGDHVD